MINSLGNKRLFLLPAIVGMLAVAGSGVWAQSEGLSPGPTAQSPSDGAAAADGQNADGQNDVEENYQATGAPLNILPQRLVPGPYIPNNETRLESTQAALPGEEGNETLLEIVIAPSDDIGDGVQIGALEAIDPATIGLLDDSNGGLGYNLWSGTSRMLVETLLPRLPVTESSPTLRGLSRALLLTSAAVPEGPGSGTGSGTDLLRLRLERLAASGDLDTLRDLLARVPAGLDDAKLARLKVDIFLLSEDYDAACADARAMVRRADDPFWLRILIFCQTLEGDQIGASMSLEILQEQSAADPVFLALLGRLRNPDAPEPEMSEIASLGEPSPLYLSLLKTARVAVPVDALFGASPTLVRAVATAPNAAPELRLEASVEAARKGALPVARLRALYASLEFSPEERANAVGLAQAGLGPRINALLYQEAVAAENPRDQARLLVATWKLARESDSYWLEVEVNLPTVLALTPAPDLVGYAPEMARALLASGEVERAQAWYEIARLQASPENLEATKAVLDLWPLLLIAGGETVPWSTEILDLWWGGQLVLPRDERQRRASLVYVLFEAFDYRVPDQYWNDLLSGDLDQSALMPSAALWRSLLAAANDGRRGETILLILLGTGGQALEDIQPNVLESMLLALRKIGLGAEARRVAIEAALASGL